ncbi:hypothetical protein FALBO_7270 [Fusarium albosuccineum]|uniref:Uncharacterized protein n=1 Tax=Fusarium albosuccineum TaxID=1237068 RepID=A0A8H4LAJ5_9HYPO|nr:hypothetical protein FALBO_7270 [Fusarium albosuccineum]
MERILTASDHDVQTNLWQEGPVLEDDIYFKDTLRSSFYWLFEHADSPRYFVSALSNGTTTGVLRQHAARMDTQVNCPFVESFPSPCPGQRPFQTAFSHDIVSVHICAEGAFDQSPWTRSRDRETVPEQLWIQVDGRSVELLRDSNYTMRCDANSTRGWFELGNFRNNYTRGPLLESWPTAEEIRTDFNDKSPVMSINDYPSREEPEPRHLYFSDWVHPPDPFHTYYALPTPGPLTTAAIAMFGNSSFFYTAKMAQADESLSRTFTQICQHGRLPFYRFNGVWESSTGLTSVSCNHLLPQYGAKPEWLAELVLALFRRMENPDTARRMFEVASYFANEALLIHTAQRDIGNSREIMSAPGATLIKPQGSLRSLVVLSILIGVQSLALIILLCYIYSQPTWTGALDAEVLINLGIQLGEEGQEISRTSGIIGVVLDDKTETLSVASMSDEEQRTQMARENFPEPLLGEKHDAVAIGLGGLGPITRKLTSKRWKMA